MSGQSVAILFIDLSHPVFANLIVSKLLGHDNGNTVFYVIPSMQLTSKRTCLNKSFAVLDQITKGCLQAAYSHFPFSSPDNSTSIPSTVSKFGQQAAALFLLFLSVHFGIWLNLNDLAFFQDHDPGLVLMGNLMRPSRGTV